MRMLSRVLGALGLFGVSAASVLGPVAAQQTQQAQIDTDLQLREREACEDALRRNTIEALEEFLIRYPNGTEACQTLALNALAAFGPPEGGQGGPRPDHPGNIGYGG